MWRIIAPSVVSVSALAVCLNRVYNSYVTATSLTKATCSYNYIPPVEQHVDLPEYNVKDDTSVKDLVKSLLTMRRGNEYFPNYVLKSVADTLDEQLPTKSLTVHTQEMILRAYSATSQTEFSLLISECMNFPKCTSSEYDSLTEDEQLCITQATINTYVAYINAFFSPQCADEPMLTTQRFTDKVRSFNYINCRPDTKDVISDLCGMFDWTLPLTSSIADQVQKSRVKMQERADEVLEYDLNSPPKVPAYICATTLSDETDEKAMVAVYLQPCQSMPGYDVCFQVRFSNLSIWHQAFGTIDQWMKTEITERIEALTHEHKIRDVRIDFVIANNSSGPTMAIAKRCALAMSNTLYGNKYAFVCLFGHANTTKLQSTSTVRCFTDKFTPKFTPK